jgi:Protein kinase domain
MTSAVSHRDAALPFMLDEADLPGPRPIAPPIPLEDPARPSPPLVDPEPPREPDEPPLRIDEPPAQPDDVTPPREPAMRDDVRELFPCPPLAVGTLLADGRYTVRGIAGVGACGTVYEAARSDGALCALKVPHEEHVRTPHGAARFLTEITLASSVHHANLAAVDERGELPDGRPFMAMELVRGESVAERLARGVLSLSEALTISDGVLRALEALGERNIVHRDVKPANVLLGRGAGAPRVVLVDFGTATLREEAPPGAARRGTSLIGTPDYMAPEQFDGRPVDARTDVYGAGALLFEMLTGRAPLCELGAGGWRGERTPLRALRLDASAALEAALLRALAPEPDARFPDARAFRRALGRARHPKLRTLRPLLAVPALAAAAYLLAPWVVDTQGGQPHLAKAEETAVPAQLAPTASSCDGPSLLLAAEGEPAREALGVDVARMSPPCARVP